MKRMFVLLLCWIACGAIGPELFSADSPAPTDERSTTAAEQENRKMATAAAAAAATAATREVRSPHFLEHLVDLILDIFNIRTSGNTVTHYIISAILLVIALLARRIVTNVLFPVLRKLSSKTSSTLDDKLFPALEAPLAAFAMLIGIFASLRVLKLTPQADEFIRYGSRVAFSLAIFWGLWRLLAALLDHAGEVARSRSSTMAAFMPWIKKTLLTVFVVFAVLLTIQGFGYDVKAILAGLGIGGLAFALAAQDTLANIFGAVVVAIDQPFRIGEFVKIGGNVGGVEDIGLRSTRIRLVDKSLMVVPNKIVAAETITNFSRFTRRRFEQVIGLTYRTKPEEMNAMVVEIRNIITSQPEVDHRGVMVFFRDFSASSLDIWVVYEIPNPDFLRAMQVKQRINVAIMQLVEARGLSFAFPTQTVELAGTVVEKLVENRAGDTPQSRD